MAGSRHYWWEDILKGVNPARWLGKRARKAVKRAAPKTERRRGSREFGQRKTSPRRRVPSETTPPTPIRETRRGDPFREIWQDEGAGPGYRRAREFFDSLPGVADADEYEREELWESFVSNMILPSDHLKRDPQNPFWSDIGLHPTGRGFDWQEYRAVMDKAGSP